MNLTAQQIYNDLNSNDIRELERTAKSKLAALNKSSRVIKEEVFNILADNSIFLQYPVKDLELCAFVCKKKDTIFSFVNSFIPLEKQIFAAAHELYHIWFEEDQLCNGEILKTDVVDSIFGNLISQSEAKANLFAAIFLVPKEVLLNELDYLKIKRSYFDSENIKELKLLTPFVKLMNMFGVPYKAIVRRLYEVDYIEAETCVKLLGIPDREEYSGVRLAQKRLQIGEELQLKTNIIRFEGLVNNAISAFEAGKISESKFKTLLSYARKTPEEFGYKLNSDQYSEEELLKLIGEDEELGEMILEPRS